MALKSMIDWNEIVPRLPKSKRDDLYLEAVAILSSEDRLPKRRQVVEPAPVEKEPRMLLRKWRDEHPGEQLIQPGRKFKINRDVKISRPDSKTGKVIQLLLESKHDIITAEGLGALLKGQKLEMNSGVSYLWSRSVIDISTEKFIGVAT